MDTQFQSLAAQLAALEESNVRRAMLEATSSLKFIDNECREAAFRLIRPEIKKTATGDFINEKENLPLRNYVESRVWIGAFCVPEPEAPTEHVVFGKNAPVLDAAGQPFRAPVGAVDIDTIKPGMSAEARAQARAAISAALKKL